MPETLASKISRCENTAKTFEKLGWRWRAMSRHAGDKYQQDAEYSFARAERCRKAAARLRRKMGGHDG